MDQYAGESEGVFFLVCTLCFFLFYTDKLKVSELHMNQMMENTMVDLNRKLHATFPSPSSLFCDGIGAVVFICFLYASISSTFCIGSFT